MERKNDRLPIFTERFRELQEGRSNTEFADFLGISRQTVGFYCNGDRVPDALTLIKIAQKCGVSADWLLGLSAVPSPDLDTKCICEKTGLSEDSVISLKKYCGTDSNDFVLFLIDNLLNENLWLIYQSYARSASRYWIQAELSSIGKTKGQLAAEEYNATIKTFENIFGNKDVPSTVEISARHAGDFLCNEAVRIISEIVIATIKEYKDWEKSTVEDARNSGLNTKNECEILKKSAELAFLSAQKLLDDLDMEDKQ